ncbi:hypothetical protein QR680_004091 [Steinernema hermaphroditum]|uniref:FLYWCH-type domain-containing protein n=1 Tax=Steinernema hermaphroditum TaxID=289476 RepID=A0AA39HNP2_9BILA|nr:hypothetical protein QR680_004091 [Steinernema hermaphroditum]
MFASVFAAFGATTEQGSSTEVQSSESLIPATTVIVTTADSTTEAASSSGTASSDVPGQQDGDVEEDLAPWGAFPASSTTFLGRSQFVQTERKKEKLCFDGHMYIRDRTSASGDVVFWRCDQRAVSRCKARLHLSTTSGEVAALLQNHNHDSAVARCEAQKIANMIKDRAASTMETPAQLRMECMAAAKPGRAVLSALPHKSALRMIAHRARKSKRAPPAPTSLDQLVIPNEFKVYDLCSGTREPFLLLDSLVDDPSALNRILVFGRESTMLWARTMKHIYFTGHLLRRYNTEPDFAVEARKILALAFVKPEDLDRAVCELSESWEEVEHRGEDDGEDLITTDLSVLEPVLKWFEDNYMGKVDRRGNRRSPQFAVDMWNCHDRVLKNDPRTNNRAEAAHRRLQRELGADHPSIWKFIESLRKVQIGVDKSFEDMLIGRPAEQKRKKYRDADLRIRRLVDGYDEDNLLDFLRGIATNIGMS